MDELIYQGGEIKALGNGKIGGFLVMYSTDDMPDLTGEYFTKNTEFFLEDGARIPVLYDHGLDPVLKRRKLGMAKIERKDAGLWLEAQLSLRDDYEKAVYSLVKEKKAGWSSGAASHMADRKKGKKATEITEWGLAEASITVRPADYNNQAVPLKSYQGQPIAKDDGSTDESIPAKTFAQNSLATVLSKHIDDRVDDGRNRESIIKSLARESGLQVETIDLILSDSFRANDANLKAFARVLDISFDALKSATRRDYARTIKGMFEEALADNVPSRWQLDSIYCDLMRKIAATAQASSVTGVDFDSEAKIKEATAEYLSRLQSLAITQVNDYVESGSDEPFYLKAIINTSTEGLETDHLDLPQHSELVASAETGIMKRFRRFYETRIKAGRVLSDKTRKVVQSVRDNAAQLVSDCDALLEETKPMASDEAMRAVQTRHLARRSQRRQAQLGA